MLAAAAASAAADPGYYVVTAYDNEGQRSIDLRYWTVKKPNQPAKLWPEIGVGYGVTSRWHTELLRELHRHRGHRDQARAAGMAERSCC